ncbi:hypothetical protein GCM10009677_03900 [Sphaerisporangium rubeum]|uniref:SnoaL-like domain-containing protein n=1 Tax=Sphaerisporangium rubeum TaxID=321317 RepID=A0A7X0I8V1_9ACTN|nr:hypothetical protein [Sphaerisporangium rubeum]MBB6470767.1 hypothetical protein [Sphaerisporangium rubeum]
MSDQVSEEVRTFFEEFSRAGDTLDTTAISTQFADTFLSADPSGTQPVPRSAFLAALPAREKLFASIGVGSIHLTSLTETRLDDHYILVDTRWQGTPATPGGEPLDLSSAYILHRAPDGTLRIVFYLNHQDLREIVRARS